MTEYDSLQNITNKAYQNLMNASEYRGELGYGCISTSFDDLDAVLGGLNPGSLITIGGTIGIGKSAFMQNLLYNISVTQKIPTLLFSAEMSNVHIVNRLLAIHTGIELRKIECGLLKPDEWMKMDNSIKNFSAPLFFENTNHLYIEDVIRVAKNASANNQIKLIAIDYLQMMYYRDKMNETRYVEINSIICKLKSLAMELQVPIIVLSQLNRNIDWKNKDVSDLDSYRPTLSNLRDSGTIGEDSDIIMFVERPEAHHIYEKDGEDLRGKAFIMIAKNRLGNTKDIELCFDNQTLKFKNIKEWKACHTDIDDLGNYDAPFGTKDAPVPGLDDMPY